MRKELAEFSIVCSVTILQPACRLCDGAAVANFGLGFEFTVLILILNVQVTDFVQSPGFAGRPRASILCGMRNFEYV